jgi:outer membrane lipoprotein-sorting protein
MGSASRRIVVPLALVVSWAEGCAQSETTGATAAASLTTDSILDRCAASFYRIRTIQARGTFRDLRAPDRRAVPIAWDLARPGRCRLLIGEKVALVIGDDWWSYDASEGQFRKHKAFTKTPMETAATLISNGVSFLLPALFARGENAFGKSRSRGYGDWRLVGVAWSSQRPCYVVARAGPGGDAPASLRVWIDQDTYLLRGWDVVQTREGGRETTVLECTYDELIVDAPIPAERFTLSAPAPFASTQPAVAE